MQDFNLLVSYGKKGYFSSLQEIERLLKKIGDDKPRTEKAKEDGEILVKTELKTRELISELNELAFKEPSLFGATTKWIPVDNICPANIIDIKNTVRDIKTQIQNNETWNLEIEKRKSNLNVEKLKEEIERLFDQQKNSEHPEKILRIEILGSIAGVSILRKKDVFLVV